MNTVRRSNGYLLRQIRQPKREIVDKNGNRMRTINAFEDEAEHDLLFNRVEFKSYGNKPWEAIPLKHTRD